jgi:MFS transporter, MHS family, shikimate and dehydroshikimate transport protein
MTSTEKMDALPLMAAPSADTEMRRIVWASVLGTVVEWYDFLIYGSAAALVFNKLFFPSLDPVAGQLAAFAALAVGFVARPLGGALFGHFGDRLGRKAMLTMTMLIMGGGTFLIGCLPTYSQIGLWAPVLLVVLRLFQGIGIGGEWGGAVLMVIEHAPADKRGLYGSLVQIGFPAGVAGSTATFLWLTTLPETDFLSWGWRLPFLASIILVAVGVFIRLRLVETPAFARVQQAQKVARAPLLEILTEQPRTFLVAAGIKVSEVAWVYVLTVFTIVYATGTLGLSRGLILNAILWAALLEFVTMPLFGWLSDKVGRRPLYFAGAVVSAVFAFLLFRLMDTKDATIIIVTIAIAMSLTHALMFGPQAAFMPELFGTRVRYSGASLGCQVAAAISGGFSPIISLALLEWSGSTWPVSLYLVGLATITFIATLAAVETRNLDIARS